NGDATNGYYPTIDLRPLGSVTRGGLIESFSNQGGLWLYGRGGPTSLQSDSASNVVSRVIGAAGQTGDYLQLQSNGSTVGDVMTVTSGGSLGLGAPTPATKLDVNGDAQFGSGVNKSTFSASGALTLAPNAAVTLSGANGSITTASS